MVHISKMMLTFGTFFQQAFATHLCHKLEDNFRRTLGLYVLHKLMKCSASSLTDLLKLHLGLWSFFCSEAPMQRWKWFCDGYGSANGCHFKSKGASIPFQKTLGCECPLKSYAAPGKSCGSRRVMRAVALHKEGGLASLQT